MPISDYLRGIRQHVGTALVLMPAVVGLIWNEDGDILLMRRSDNGLWDVPSGAPDPGEAPAQALVREVYEETGLKVVPEGIRGVFGGLEYRMTYPNGDVTEYLVIAFECRVVGGSLQAVDGEATEFRYCRPDAIPDLFGSFPSWLFDRTRRPDQAWHWDPAWLEF